MLASRRRQSSLERPDQRGTRIPHPDNGDSHLGLTPAMFLPPLDVLLQFLYPVWRMGGGYGQVVFRALFSRDAFGRDQLVEPVDFVSTAGFLDPSPGGAGQVQRSENRGGDCFMKTFATFFDLSIGDGLEDAHPRLGRRAVEVRGARRSRRRCSCAGRVSDQLAETQSTLMVGTREILAGPDARHSGRRGVLGDQTVGPTLLGAWETEMIP